MYAKLLGLLLFACQIILNGSHVIHETTGEIVYVTPKLVPVPFALPEGYVRFPDVHSAYKVYTTPLTWVQARDRCIADGADLAIANTVQKIELIYGLQSEVDDWISVGIRKSETSDDWVGVDNGLPLASIAWAANNPDDAGDCSGISFDGLSLVNFGCDVLQNWYVCEIPI